jgi:uncharacterized protein (DUF3820 family)
MEYLREKDLLNDELEQAINDYYNMKAESSPLIYGKYKGKQIVDVAKWDPNYLKWMTRQSWCKESVKQAIEKLNLP